MAAPTVVGKRLHFAAQADALDEYMIIEHIRWVKPAVSQNDLSITNTNGDVIAIASCPTTLDDQLIPMYGFGTDGVIIATMDGGTCDIYLRDGR